MLSFFVVVSKSDFELSNRTRFRKLFAEIDETITSQTKQQKKTAVAVFFRRVDIDISDFDKQNSEIDMKCNSKKIRNSEKIESRRRQIAESRFVVDFVYLLIDLLCRHC